MNLIAPMLARSMPDGLSLDDFSDFVAEEKFDGHRILFEVSPDGDVRAWSRLLNSRLLPAHVHDEVRKLPPGIYDSELFVPKGVSTDVRALHEAQSLHLAIFDQVILDLEWHRRHEDLVRRGANLSNPAVFIVPVYAPKWDVLRRIWARNGEGVILKDLTGKYLPGKRSACWIKVKKVNSACLQIVGFEEGRLGPYSKILLLDGASGIHTAVKTLNSEWRAAIEANPNRFLGKNLIIAYQDRTRDGGFRSPMADHFEEELL